MKQLIEDLDFVHPDAHTSSHASPFNFEDSDSALKMTIKGPSPTMGHGSRSHRVDLDWVV